MAKLFPLLFFFSSLCLAEPLPPITLKQALKEAQSLAPELSAAIGAKKNSILAEETARASLLPSFDAQATHLYSNVGGSAASPSTHTPWSNALTLSASETFYDNGESLRQIQIAKLNRAANALIAEKSRQLTLLQVAKSFFDFSSSTASAEIERGQIELLRKQFRAIEGRYRQGATSSRDFIRIKAQLLQAESGLTSTKAQLEDSLAALRSSIGLKSAVDFVPVAPEAFNLDTAKDMKIDPEATLDLQIARLQDEISDIKVASVVRENFPRVSLKGSFTYGKPQYFGPSSPGTDDPGYDFRTSLVVDFSLWDWGTRRRNVEVSENQRTIDRSTRESTRITVAQAVHRLEAQDRLLRQELREFLTVLTSQQEIYSGLNRDYQEGKASYLDLITSLNDLFGAKSRVISLRFSVLKTRVELAFYQGNLDEVLVSY